MTAPRQKILMCPPDHYGVDYVINPWMEGQMGQTVQSLAQQQWANLRTALAREADIAVMQAESGLPDLVFTANAGIVLGNTVVVSHFRPKERQGEEIFFKTWFEKNGFTVAPWPKNVFFEGAGDALFDRAQPILWCGHGFRSDAQAATLLEKLYGRQAVPVRLVDPRFYHLDTCLCPLPGGWLMYYPSAFDAESQKKIAELVQEEKRIIVSERDAMQYACNAVDLNGKIFMNDATETLKIKLQSAGFKPILTPLSEFLKAGGTAKCLTLKLVEP